MDVSTRAQRCPSDGMSGAWEALRLAAWFAPLLVPLGLLQALLIKTPWLDSLEAAGQDALLSSAS